MKIALGADHGGYLLKGQIKGLLSSQGHETLDYGTDSSEPCDYPQYAYRVARAVSGGRAQLGILICKSGNGMAIVANKVPSVRAAICFDKDVAVLSRQHNDANVLVLGSEHLFDEPENIVRSWLNSNFEGGRHERRVNQIVRLEKRTFGQKSRSRPAQSGRRR
jgi:ribose 5-phosphate isomerase B